MGAVRSPFTYRTWDLMTLEEKDPVPLKNVTFGEELNSDGGFQGDLPIASPEVQRLSFLAATLTGRTLLGVEYEEELVWGGIIWTRRYKKSEASIKLGATTPGSYFKSILQKGEYANTWEAGAEPIEVVKKIMEDSQLAEHALRFEIVTHKTGAASHVKVSYPLPTPQVIQSIMSTLSELGLGTGFDWSFDVSYKPGTTTPVLTFAMYFPLRGRNIAETGVQLLGCNCTDFEWPEDSTNQAWSITENGSGGIRGSATYTQPGIAGWPLLEALKSRTNTGEAAALAQAAEGDLSAYAWPVVTPTFELPLYHLEDGVQPGWFSFSTLEPGDEFIFRVDPIEGGGRNVDPRFPNGIESIERLLSWSCAVPDKGLVKLNYTTAPPPAENGSPPEPESLST
jgi:hypothetical protein